MASTRRAFVVMPFGKKKGPDGLEIDCDAIYTDLLAPAIADAGLTPHRADADRRGGSIHLDMFQDLLLAEFVVADLTLDNPNVWYEIGVRHALRSGGSVLLYALRDRLPFDIAGQRMQKYTLKEGKPDPAVLTTERKALTDAIIATLGAWRGRKASPVYQQIPSLKEPDWKTLKVGDINEYWQKLESWQSRVTVARRKQHAGDILVLAEETPSSILEFEALRAAADALLKLGSPGYALRILEQARALDPDDVRARQLEAIALGRVERYADAREAIRVLAETHKDGETLGILARTWKDEWQQVWKTHPQRASDPLVAARDTAAALQNAAVAYADAFRSDPANSFPGINALTLGRLWEHVTGRKSKLLLDLITDGLGWCTTVAVERDKDYWALATRAELALVTNRKDEALDDYQEAAALAVTNRDRFALDSTSQQLDFLKTLGFRQDIVDEACPVIDRAETQLAALLGPRQVAPKHVVVFSGHMIDNPKNRGEGKAKPPRFPPSKIEAAGEGDPSEARQDRRRRRRPRSLRRRVGGRPAVRGGVPRTRDAAGAPARADRSRVPRRVGDLRGPRSPMGACVCARRRQHRQRDLRDAAGARAGACRCQRARPLQPVDHLLRPGQWTPQSVIRDALERRTRRRPGRHRAHG